MPEGISEKLHRTRVRSRDKHGATGNDISYIWYKMILYDIVWYEISYMIWCMYDMKYHIWYDVCMIWYIKGDLQYFDNGSFFESQTIIMVNKTLSLLSSSSSLSLNNYHITCPRGRWRRVRSCADRFLALCATLQDTACYNLFNCKFL